MPGFKTTHFSLARPAGTLVPGAPGGQQPTTGAIIICPPALCHHPGPAVGPTFPPGVGPNPGIGLPDPGASPRYAVV